MGRVCASDGAESLKASYIVANFVLYVALSLKCQTGGHSCRRVDASAVANRPGVNALKHLSFVWVEPHPCGHAIEVSKNKFQPGLCLNIKYGPLPSLFGTKPSSPASSC